MKKPIRKYHVLMTVYVDPNEAKDFMKAKRIESIIEERADGTRFMLVPGDKKWREIGGYLASKSSK